MDEQRAGVDWRRLDPGLEIVDAGLVDPRGFWERSRRGRAMPGRADFTLENLWGHLGWVILLDVETAPRRFRFRLIGSGIAAVLSRDSTGRYLDELFAPAIREEAMRPYSHVVEHRRPVRSVGRTVHADKGHIPYEALYLPYSDSGNRVDLILERVRYQGIA